MKKDESLHVKVISLYRYMTHILCMFHFLVHMLFCGPPINLIINEVIGPPAFSPHKRAKRGRSSFQGTTTKKAWIYILKGHCPVRSIKCFFPIWWRPSASINCFQFLMPVCLDTPVCALSLHETFPLEVLQAEEVNTILNLDFYIIFHLFIYIFIYIYIYILIYVCVVNIHTLRISFHSLYFGDMGGMFCSFPVCLEPLWGEPRWPKGGRLCCSRSLNPPVLALGGPLLRLNPWESRAGRPSLALQLPPVSWGRSGLFAGLVGCSSTLLTRSSLRGCAVALLGLEAGAGGGGSLGGRWHTSA